MPSRKKMEIIVNAKSVKYRLHKRRLRNIFFCLWLWGIVGILCLLNILIYFFVRSEAFQIIFAIVVFIVATCYFIRKNKKNE